MKKILQNINKIFEGNKKKKHLKKQKNINLIQIKPKINIIYSFLNIHIKDMFLIRFSILICLIIPVITKNFVFYNRKLQETQEITIKVIESGEQEVINSEYADKPTVIINGNVENIDENNKVTIPEGVDTIILKWDRRLTNLEKMFSGLSNIVEIDFSNFDSSEVNRMKYLFENCINLKKITFGENFSTSEIDSMFNIFFNCHSLTSLDLIKFDTSKVREIQNLFYNCYSLTSLDLSSFNTSLVNDMTYIFYNCTSLSSLILSSFDTTKVSDIHNMFCKCSSLTSLDLSNFYTPLVKNMEQLFSGCSSLEFLKVPNFDTSKTTNFNFMFNSCTSLKFLDLSSFNTKLVKNMNEMFNGCNSITSLDLSSFKTNSCIKMNKIFKNCYLLTSLDVSGFNTTLITNLESFFEGCKSLISIDVSNFITSSCITMANMFSNCESLTSIDISNFNTTLVTNMKNMFNKCKSLSSLDFSSFNTKKVTSFERMFDSCSLLESLDLSNFDTSSANKMQKMFYNCISLTSLDISNFDTSLVDSTEYMFYNCIKLISLDLSSFATSNIKTMEKMFYKCGAITSLDLSNFDTSLITNMISMFEDCSNLNYINLNNFIENENLVITNMFKGTQDNLIYCIQNENLTPNIKMQLHEKECGILDCDTNWKQNYENLIEEKKKDFNALNDKCIIKDIEEIIDNFYFSNSIPSVSIYSYNLDSSNEYEKKITNLTFIDFSDGKKRELLKKYGVDENEKLYVFISDSPSNDSRVATSEYNYRFILENGTQLNLSYLKEDFYVNVTVPIRDLELANFNYAKYFSESGYDIYDKKDNFYNDVCSPASINNNDIILKDRKIDIYPNNVTLCKGNCQYKEFNIEDQRIVCECNLNADKINENLNEDDDFLKESEGNFFDYILDNFNYKIFKCFNLFFNYKNLIKNPAFYIIISIFITVMTCSLVFIFSGLSKIRIFMFKQLPTEPKIRNEIIQHLKKIKEINKKNKINISNKNNPPKKQKSNDDNKENIYKKKKNKNKLINNKNIDIIFIYNKTDINHNIEKINNKKGNINKKKKNKKRNYNKYDNIRINTEENLIENKNKKKHKKNKNKKASKKNKKIKNKNNVEIDKNKEYNKLPYTQALREDNRNFFEIYISFLFDRIDIINLFSCKGHFKLIEICQYLLLLLLDFFFNALFYSDEIVSHKYHNNGKLDFIVTFILSILSNVITAIFIYFIENTKRFEEILELVLEIKKEYKYLYALNKYIKYVKIRMVCFMLTEILIMICCLYYIVIFCIAYSQSQKSLLINFLSSLLEGLIKTLIVTTIVSILRKIGISCRNSYIYNTTKFIDENF